MQYGFGHEMVRVSSKNELNKYVSDEQIYHHYLGDFVVDEYMESPRGETNPSFKIDVYDDQLMWRDFGYDPRPGDAVNLVQFLEDIQGRRISYHDTMQKILMEVNGKVPYTVDVTAIRKEKADIRLRYRHKFLPFEAEYWRGEKLRKATIRKYNVFPGEIWYNERVWHHSRPGDPLFVYLWSAPEAIYKGYRPLAPERRSRFIESNCQHRVQGWEWLTPDHTCIITKSYKDVMSYSELGYVAVAPQAESLFLTEDQLKHLRKHYPNLYINYDPDDAGMRNMKRYSEEHDLPYFHFGNEGVKDLTELRKRKDDRYVDKVIHHLLHQ